MVFWEWLTIPVEMDLKLGFEKWIIIAHWAGGIVEAIQPEEEKE